MVDASLEWKSLSTLRKMTTIPTSVLDRILAYTVLDHPSCHVLVRHQRLRRLGRHPTSQATRFYWRHSRAMRPVIKTLLEVIGSDFDRVPMLLTLSLRVMKHCSPSRAARNGRLDIFELRWQCRMPLHHDYDPVRVVADAVATEWGQVGVLEYFRTHGVNLAPFVRRCLQHASKVSTEKAMDAAAWWRAHYPPADDGTQENV
ncbi:hypothetical protein BC828DRAFT_392616 [Blastocladiella britannica]|nr:hypothetical protein BC828DRAFT_392616 [Blastocladiella britannica]